MRVTLYSILSNDPPETVTSNPGLFMTIMAHFSLIILVIILCSVNQTACEVYYIAEDSNECWTSPCLTVSQFSTNSSQYLRSNTTLVFLPGRHHLTNTLVVSNLYCLSLVSENSIAQIECIRSAHILFDFFYCVHITNLQFIGCEGNHVKNVKQLVVRDSTFQGQMKIGSALQLSETMAEVVNTTFLSRVGTCVFDPLFGYTFVGGAIHATNSKVGIIQNIMFRNNSAHFGGVLYYANNTIILVGKCVFSHNFASIGGVLVSLASTITIEESRFDSNHVVEWYGGVLFSNNSNIAIRESKFSHNHANWGGVLFSNISNITIEASTFAMQ